MLFADLDSESLGDLVVILPRAEKALRERLKTSAGKTVANYAEAVRSFCSWCRKRGYLDHQPLEGMAPVVTPLICST